MSEHETSILTGNYGKWISLALILVNTDHQFACLRFSYDSS
jgi:hypothetical protein